MPGYKDSLGSISRPETDDLLWSTNGLHVISVMLDKAAVDTGNAGNTSLIRKGAVLVPVTATGLYREYDDDLVNGQQLTANAVILFNDVRVDGVTDQPVKVVRAGCPRLNALKFKDAGASTAFLAARSTVQRLDIK